MLNLTNDSPVLRVLCKDIPFYIRNNAKMKSILNHHDFAEFSFVLDGFGTEVINGKKHPIQPGIFSFIPPHSVHVMYSESETPIQRYCCMFDIHFLSRSSLDAEFFNLLSRIGHDFPAYTEFSAETSSEIKRLLSDLYWEFLHPFNPGRSSMIRSKLVEVLVHFFRTVSQTERKTTLPFRQNENLEFWDILQFIHMHHREKITLEVLSKKLYFSASYISRCLSSHLGMSLPRYLHMLRIDSALGMLASPDMSITDIAYTVGFESFRTFSRAFREIHGKSPREYRREAIENSRHQISNRLKKEPWSV